MSERYDVIIIGGGPTGSTAAITLARKGFKVVVLERDAHPKFHVGESFLPRGTEMLRDLGLEKELAALPQVEKLGAEFGFAHELNQTAFRFDWGLPVGGTVTFSLERAPFDAMLFRAAREAGATLIERTTVREILELEDGRVALATDSGRYEAKYLIDASGQGTVVARHLGTRKVLPGLKRVAYFNHFENVLRKPGYAGGYVAGIICKEGWFWAIPISERKTSIGLVAHADLAKQVGVRPNEMLAWAIRRCPELAFRCKDAVIPPTNGVTSDFSYTCKPYAGPGYYLAGDAAVFLDPIFSTGVCLGMSGAKLAAEQIASILREGADPTRLRQAYIDHVESSSAIFFRLVFAFYDHTFRELFLHGYGPFETHRGIISLLAGHAFPPHPSVIWRVWLLELFMELQRVVPLVPRRDTFSLVEGRPVPAERGRHQRFIAMDSPDAPAPGALSQVVSSVRELLSPVAKDFLVPVAKDVLGKATAAARLERRSAGEAVG